VRASPLALLCLMALLSACGQLTLNDGKGGRETLAGRSREFHPQVDQKYSWSAAAACADGVYRTAVQITGHDSEGRRRESTWDYSTTVEDPCEGKPS
jgi:hypothetical protein